MLTPFYKILLSLLKNMIVKMYLSLCKILGPRGDEDSNFGLQDYDVF
jgi:hypothetical protein